MKALIRGLAIVIACALSILQPAMAADGRTGNLASVEWLVKNLGGRDILLLDASGTKAYTAKHIPGAVSVDLWRYGVPYKVSTAEMEKRIQSWGVDAGRKVVIYDEGGGQTAPWLFFELYYHGYPAANLFILDGGLAKWEATGGAVTAEPTVAKAGNFRLGTVREESRVRLDEFVSASRDTTRHAVVEALEPTYHFGGTKWFDRSGHVPNALMMPTADFYNADKTFKSPEEIRRMASYLGIKPEQQINSHCGGGIAATVPFFGLKFVSGYQNVKLYRESQLEWLQDERGLPFWTYDAPYLKRDAQWVQSWGGRMLRMYGVAQISVVDVRSPEEYRQGHLPWAVNIPAETFKANFNDPRKLAELLGPAGVDAGHEAVIVSSGLNEGSALAWLALERLGQKKVSVLMDSTDDWGLKGFPIAKDPTIVGAPKSPQDMAVRPAVYRAEPRAGIVIEDPQATRGIYPKVFLASGKKAPAKAPDGKVIHVPYADLLNSNGAPKPANEIWNILAKAGVPRYAEIIVIADEPGEAAAGYYLLKLMGYPDVKVLV